MHEVETAIRIPRLLAPLRKTTTENSKAQNDMFKLMETISFGFIPFSLTKKRRNKTIEGYYETCHYL